MTHGPGARGGAECADRAGGKTLAGDGAVINDGEGQPLVAEGVDPGEDGESNDSTLKRLEDSDPEGDEGEEEEEGGLLLRQLIENGLLRDMVLNPYTGDTSAGAGGSAVEDGPEAASRNPGVGEHEQDKDGGGGAVAKEAKDH